MHHLDIFLHFIPFFNSLNGGVVACTYDGVLYICARGDRSDAHRGSAARVLCN